MLTAITEQASETALWVIAALSQLEGPYKWYAIGLLVLVLTGLVTRFIFKTFKWFILLAAIALLVLGGMYMLSKAAGL